MQPLQILDTLSRWSCRCPALADVSSRDGRHADYALAYLIRQQGSEDKVFVAQSEKQLLGCMAVTSKVDTSALQQNFELQSYDQLVQPEVYEAAVARCTHRLRAAATGQGHNMYVVAFICWLADSVPLLSCSCDLHAVLLILTKPDSEWTD